MNGFCNAHPISEYSVRPERHGFRGSRRDQSVPTAVFMFTKMLSGVTSHGQRLAQIPKAFIQINKWLIA